MTLGKLRHELTRCRRCDAHLQADEALTRCVFCLDLNTVQGGGLMGRLVARGRGGLIAASLFGLSAIAACDEPGDSSPTADGQAEVQVDASPDVVPLPPYGIPPEPDVSAPEVTPDAEPEAGPQPP